MRPRVLAPALLLAILISAAAAQPRAGVVVDEKVPSPALEGNKLGDSATRNVSVYLPPSYPKSKRRYPVLYLLHGYTGTNRMFQNPKFVDAPGAANRRFAQDPAGEFIIVIPDGHNLYAGSFYSDSAVTGDWETFLARDLVSYVDRKYRTQRGPASRGIAGHSMGGYGALKLAMNHPDVFGSVYALSPCCLAWGKDMSLENPAWAETLNFRTVDDVQRAMQPVKGEDEKQGLHRFFTFAFVALAAAWSPDPDKPPLFVDLPVEPAEKAWQPVPEVEALWSANMALYMAPQHRGNLKRLKAIAFDVGRQEEFDHILRGVRDLSRLLEQNGIAHTFEQYDGDHSNRIPRRLEEKLIPFFSRVFATAAAKARAAGE